MRSPALDPSKTVAILIGMTEFEGFDPIKSASRNVDGLASILTDKTIFGLPDERIYKIIDKTSIQVIREIRQYVLDIQQAEVKTLLLYYTGHGYKRTDGKYFLTANDSDPVMINDHDSTAIAYEGDVKKILKGARIPQIIVIIDACYSGVVAQSADNILPDLDLKASYTLTSSAATETSLFDVTHDFTYFTATLISLLRDGVSNGKAMLTLADLYDALRSSMREKKLKMSPQQGVGKELQPHLYTFCKNKAFDPILEQIQELEQEIDQTAEQIKRGAVKSSEVYLRKLKAEVEQGGISSMDVGHRLLSRIEDLLTFCEWYLKYEKTFLNEIFQHIIKPRLEAKETELSNLRQNFKLKEIELSEKYQNVLNDVEKHKASYETEISQLNKKLKDSIQKQSKLEALLIAKQEDISTLMKEMSRQSFLVSKSSYDKNIKYLSLLASRVLEGQKRLGIVSDARDTEILTYLITNETFKILVVGEFNVGKSTFINALIGEDILPTKAIPSTGITNILKYGETKKALLHFKDKEKRPLNIPVEKLSNYVLIKNSNGEDDVKAEIRNAPFSHAEIWWPLDLLKDNMVEIIDSPGLNENKVREDITMDYLNKVDAVLFLMSAVRFGPAQTEIDSINTFKEAEHRSLFFVVNQWDMLRPRQQEEVKSKALSVLTKLTERKNGIYFVSAIDGLEGRIENNPELEQKSGIKDFENELLQFLLQEKGKVKIFRTARKLRQIINNTLTQTIPQKIAQMKMPLHELEERYSIQVRKGVNNELISQTEASIQTLRDNLSSELFETESFSINLKKILDELDVFVKAIFLNKSK